MLYSDKFRHVGEGGDIQPTDGCLLVSSTGLLVVLVFPPDEPIIVTSRGFWACQAEDSPRGHGRHQGGAHGERDMAFSFFSSISTPILTLPLFR